MLQLLDHWLRNSNLVRNNLGQSYLDCAAGMASKRPKKVLVSFSGSVHPFYEIWVVFNTDEKILLLWFMFTLLSILWFFKFHFWTGQPTLSQYHEFIIHAIVHNYPVLIIFNQNITSSMDSWDFCSWCKFFSMVIRNKSHLNSAKE